MRYQVCSKLFGSINKLPSAKVDKKLILLGDCFPLYSGNYYYSKQLRDYCSNKWSKVYVVPGIVEICGNGMHSWINNFDKFQNFINESPNRNITILNNSEHHDGDDLLIGSIFWCGGGPSTFINEAVSNIIKCNPKLTIKDVDNWAIDDAEFIGTSIKNATLQKKNLTICTYFSPRFRTDTVIEIFRKQLGHCDSNIKGEWYTAQS